MIDFSCLFAVPRTWHFLINNRHHNSLCPCEFPYDTLCLSKLSVHESVDPLIHCAIFTSPFEPITPIALYKVLSSSVQSIFMFSTAELQTSQHESLIISDALDFSSPKVSNRNSLWHLHTKFEVTYFQDSENSLRILSHVLKSPIFPFIHAPACSM